MMSITFPVWQISLDTIENAMQGDLYVKRASMD